MGGFWVIVTEIVRDRAHAFVLLPDEVKTSANQNLKDGRVSFWLPLKAYETEDFREAWHRLRQPKGLTITTD